MNVRELLASFATKKILVIGDTIIDIETLCERIKDDENGVPTYRTILDRRARSETYSFGGAALVVRNLLELGAKVDFITATGYGIGALQFETWTHPNLTKHAIKVAKPQTTKHRFWCDGKKVMQVDTVDNTPHAMTDVVLGLKPDAIVVADYRHGLIDEPNARYLVSHASEHNIPLYVASQISQSESNHHWYAGEKAVFVMNWNEWTVSGLDYHENSIVATSLHGAEWWHHNLKACANSIDISVIDSCGAGDAFLAAFALTDSIGFANTWAGLSCTVHGANPPTQAQLLEWCEKHGAD